MARGRAAGRWASFDVLTCAQVLTSSGQPWGLLHLSFFLWNGHGQLFSPFESGLLGRKGKPEGKDKRMVKSSLLRSQVTLVPQSWSGPPLLTLFAFAGRAVIVTRLDLLLLQISLEAGQVCVQPPDVFVHLWGGGTRLFPGKETAKADDDSSRPQTDPNTAEGGPQSLRIRREIGGKPRTGPYHLIGLHGKLHLVVTKFLAFAIGLLDLSEKGQFFLGAQAAGATHIFSGQLVNFSLQVYNRDRGLGHNGPWWLDETYFFLLFLGPFPSAIKTFQLKRTERSQVLCLVFGKRNTEIIWAFSGMF